MGSADPNSTDNSSEHGKDVRRLPSTKEPGLFDDQNHQKVPSDKVKVTQDEHEVSSDSNSDDGRAYVAKYKKNAQYPLEVGDVVWIVNSQYRSPYGPFSISKAHSDNKFQLVKRSDNSVHPVLVEGKHLKRDK